MRAVLLGMVCLCLLAPACVGTPALLGSQFADITTAFSPLALLYVSYRDYLFAGTVVEIPTGVETACERFAYELAVFHVEYANQTDSATAAGLAYIVRFRVESTVFCDAYGSWIHDLAESDEVDSSLLSAAGDADLFSEIKRMNDLMGEALDEILVGLGEGIERWSFAVTFSVRALLHRTQVERIDANIREIFYADPEGTAPPFPVPDEVAEAMAQLVDLSGRDLAESEEALAMATTVYVHFIANL